MLFKLSLQLLADAFKDEEVKGRTVFAIYGKRDTLDDLRDFMKAMRQESPVVLWSASLVESHLVPEKSIILGWHTASRGTKVGDFQMALANALSDDNVDDIGGTLLPLA